MSGSVVLHIGMPKTGTSSIRHYLYGNKPAFRRRGFVLPVSPGETNHVKVALYAWNDVKKNASSLRQLHGLRSPESIRDFRTTFLSEFSREAASWKPEETVVLTSEYLSTLYEPQEFERLRRLLGTMGARPVQVVVYLRRQDLYCASQYCQRVRGGDAMSWPQMTRQALRHPRYDYATVLAKWADAFGRDRLRVRVLEKGQLIGGDLVTDFMSTIGCDGGPDFRPAHWLNKSLDTRSLEFLRQLNKMSDRTDLCAGRAKDELIRALEAISEGPPTPMPHDLARRLLERYRESNMQVARQYLGRADGRLFLEALDDEGARQPVFSVDDAVELAAKLWTAARRSQDAVQPEPSSSQTASGDSLRWSLRRLVSGLARRGVG